MFSGIIEERAEVVEHVSGPNGARLVISSKLDHGTTKQGDSIAIDGVCLTVTSIVNDRLSFDLLDETLRRSTLRNSTVGSFVNLERSLELGSRLHGHFVYGHVDSTVSLLAREKDGENEKLCFSLPDIIAAFIVSKGSIAISGISLTVGEVTSDSFSVYIIPHTAVVTNLGTLQVGEQVNVEIDMVARYLSKLNWQASNVARKNSGVTSELLRSCGFLE